MKAKILNTLVFAACTATLTGATWTTIDNGVQAQLTPTLYFGGNIVVKNGSTLTIMPGVNVAAGSSIAVLDSSKLIIDGGTFEGAIQLENNASALVRGGTFGGADAYTGTIRLEGDNELTIEGGDFGGGLFAGAISTSSSHTSQINVYGGNFGGQGPFSGQIALMGSSNVRITGGVFGGSGPASGRVQLLDQSAAHVLGGAFGGAGEEAGQIWVRDSSSCIVEGGSLSQAASPQAGIMLSDSAQLVIAGCEFNLPFGETALPLTPAWITGVLPNGGSISCPVVTDIGSSATLELKQSGLCAIDADADGILDADDAVPSSDMTPTVVIDGRDSGVPNTILANGATLMDLITTIRAQAKNHGEFVSNVAKLAGDLKGIVLSTEQKALLTKCAAGSGAGK